MEVLIASEIVRLDRMDRIYQNGFPSTTFLTAKGSQYGTRSVLKGRKFVPRPISFLRSHLLLHNSAAENSRRIGSYCEQYSESAGLSRRQQDTTLHASFQIANFVCRRWNGVNSYLGKSIVHR